MSHDHPTAASLPVPSKLDYSLTGENATRAVELGLAEADWYQTPVPRPALRRLLERRDGPAPDLSVHPVATPAEALSLAGPWAYAIEQNWGIVTPPPSDNRGLGGCNAPYSLFNSRLVPLIPYAIRGFIWYQGEANAQEASLYRRLLPLLIADWRRAWGQGDLPFLQVQLANFQPTHDEPTDTDDWPRLRAAQASVLRTDPHAGLAVAIDVGEADDIHPKDKKSVGQRLARWALNRVYGHPGLPSGPLLRSSQPTATGQLRLGFDYADGLATRDGGPVRRIEITGPDRKFRWAESRIEGEHLLVWHPEIPAPAFARYAWSNNPEGSNLVNAAALPAVPFDTTDL
jgi:sialate O-acetylesterase